MSCGCDPRDAWDYTPFELLEIIRGYRERQEDKAYLCYNLAQCIAAMCFGKNRPAPWQAFPGVIEYQQMTDDQLWAAFEAWANLGGAECGQEN